MFAQIRSDLRSKVVDPADPNIAKPIALGREHIHYFDDVGRGRSLSGGAFDEERRIDGKGRQADQRRIEFFGEAASEADPLLRHAVRVNSRVARGNFPLGLSQIRT